MEENKEYIANGLPIAEWPELERKMGIISRMTRDAPQKMKQGTTSNSENIQR
jgi:hypothetical protein